MLENTTPVKNSTVTFAVLAVVALVAMLLTLPTPARAAKPAGLPVAMFDLSAKKNPLRTGGIRLQPTGKAAYKIKRLGLTISDVRLTGRARGTFLLKDGFRVKRGRRSVTIRGMLVRVSGRNVRITGKIGKRRHTIFTGKSRRGAQYDTLRTELSVRDARLVLSKTAVKLIRKHLRRFKPRTRVVGNFRASAHVIGVQPNTPTIDPGNATNCIPVVGGVTTDLPKPAGAVDINCGYFIWAIRSSWINYLETTEMIEPAQPMPPVTPTEHRCMIPDTNEPKSYYFALPVASGWWDVASGRGALRTVGGLHFKFPDHYLNVRVRDVEVEFDGANSKLRLTSDYQEFPDAPWTTERDSFASFDTGTVRAGGPLGTGVAMTRFDTKFTPWGDHVLLDEYKSGSPAGCFDVGFNF